MTSLEEFNEKLASWDATIELWCRIPKSEPVLDKNEEYIEWSEDDWTVSCPCINPVSFLSGGYENEKC